ncbi:VanZ family protein [Paenibacillus sp. JNUCC31]|uniref:VanZ family protein n=1 Tax=Paenibacillus sp. JNUCC-31 TaxID=2777983 RepID=UPI0017876724|nr:VanZ family protein [Paenibacillus sp. JNUCC-31]QOS82179.1 VanZ family protein [Paenibacillus sp. JNUCC-31]
MSIQLTVASITVLGPLFILFLIALVFYTRVNQIRYTFRQYTLTIAFAIYILAVMHLVFFPIDVNLGIYANQTPWYKTIQFIPILTLDIPSFALNILLFLPLGFMLPLVKSSLDSVREAARIGLIFSFSIEVLQLIIRVTLGNGRSTDINDLIANTAGSIIGYLIFHRLTKVTMGQDLIHPWRLPNRSHQKHS